MESLLQPRERLEAADVCQLLIRLATATYRRTLVWSVGGRSLTSSAKVFKTWSFAANGLSAQQQHMWLIRAKLAWVHRYICKVQSVLPCPDLNVDVEDLTCEEISSRTDHADNPVTPLQILQPFLAQRQHS